MTLLRWVFEFTIYLLVLLYFYTTFEYYDYEQVYFVVFFLIFMRSVVPLLVTLSLTFGPLNHLYNNAKKDAVGKNFLILRKKDI